MTTPATELRTENVLAGQKPAAPVWLTLVRAVAPFAIGTVIAISPVPQGLPVNAWRYFALFAAVIVGVITEPIPAAAIGLSGIVIATVGRLVYASPAQATAWALSGFGNSTVWLVFAAYMFALGYSKTGLGRRISLLLIRAMGRRTLGLGYAIALADLALAPLMPSNTARSGGTVYPVIQNIPELYGSHPNDSSSRKIGAYLMYTALAATCVTSSMFATALAPNVLAVALAAKIGVTITWTTWFKGFAPAGIVLFAVVPLLLYKIYPPEIKEAPEAPRWADAELRKLGAVSKREWTLLALVSAALVMWIAGTKYIDATIAAVLAVVLMVILRVVSWDDIIGHSQAWNVLIYFATLLTMAAGLADTHFVDWIANLIASTFSGLSPVASTLLLVGAFYFIHYLFASSTAHASALIPVFLGVAIKIPGVSPTAIALLLFYMLGLMGILTPYATGPSPIYYGGGYIKGKDFWIFGFLLSVMFFAVSMAITIPWLRFLHI